MALCRAEVNPDTMEAETESRAEATETTTELTHFRSTASLETETESSRAQPTHPRTCPECNAETTTTVDAGYPETVCTACGLVVQQRAVDRGPEWRPNGMGNALRRANGAANRPDHHTRGLGSTIQQSEGSVTERHRRWNRQMRSGGSKTQRYGFNELRRVCSALGIGEQTRYRAAIIFRRGHDAEIPKRFSIDVAVGAALYAAIREQEQPYLLEEIANALRTPTADEGGTGPKRVRRAYSALVQALDLAFMPADPAIYVPRLADTLELSSPARYYASELAAQASNVDALVGRAPSTIASAVVYLACKRVSEQPRTTQPKLGQVTVADVLGISSTSLRDVYQLLAAETPSFESQSDGETPATSTPTVEASEDQVAAVMTDGGADV